MTNNATPRALELDEEALIDALISLRAKIIDTDILRYSKREVQEKLHESGAWIEHKITPMRQIEILTRLADSGIIEFDSLIDVEFINNYRAFVTPQIAPILTEQKYIWAANTEWAFRQLQQNGRISTDQAYDIYGSDIFVKMSIDDISNIITNHKASHPVQLRADPNRLCLCIKIDGEKKWRRSPSFADGTPQFPIIKHALLHPGVYHNRQSLHENNIADVRKKSLSSHVLDSRTIEALKPELCEISNDEVMFRKQANITLNQVNKLKKVFK